MHEYLSSPAQPAIWPVLPALNSPLGPVPAADPAAARTADITRLISVAGDTRRLGFASAGLLAAVLVGTAAVGSALAARGHVLAVGSVAILLPVAVSWLVTAVLVLTAEHPLTAALGELRHATGASVDPSAPWAPVGVRPLADAEVTWGHVVPLIGAANRQHARARLALGAAVFTTAAFALWMTVSLAAVTLV
jgi:hypothetical protein